MAQRDAHQATKRKAPSKAPAAAAAKSPARPPAKSRVKPEAHRGHAATGKGVQQALKATNANAAADRGELTGAIERLEAEVKSLRSERDTLTKQLEDAQVQISELESAQTDAINRIDWVIDSLHNLVDQKN